MKVKLCDVVDRITGNVDRFNTDLEFYVGGEHYENECLAIYKPGLLNSEKGKVLGFKFHFPFKKGDVLFMARNPHLKKASVVMFDGICSDASYILRTKDNNILLQEYLILVIQNDNFWKFFEENKSGSVNYLMNWKEMKNYEFDLPPLYRQKELADIAWAIEKSRYEHVMLKEDLNQVIKSRFFDLFPENNKFTKKKIKDIFLLQMGKTPARDDSLNWDGENRWISIADLGTYSKYTDDTKEKITDYAVDNCGIKPVPENTVLMSFKLTIGKTAITSEEVYTNEAIMAFIRRNNAINNEYLRHFLEYKDWSEEAKHAVKGITLNKETIGNTLISVPPLELQELFSETVIRIEKTINNVDELLSNLANALKTNVYDMMKED